MALHNTAIRYGAVTKFFHWFIALLVITLIALGLYASDLPFETQAELGAKAWYFSLHKTLGVTVFLAALARISWALFQPRPGLLNADHRWESWLAETTHWVLYGSLVIVPLAGWIAHAAASGFAPIWWPFGQGLPFIPKSTTVEHVFATLHEIAGKVLIGAVILHFLGAMKHHLIDRDATLRRMLPGTPALGPLPVQHHSAAPVLTATAAWAATIAVGLALGITDASADRSNTSAISSVPLENVVSEWQVQDGTIVLRVTPFGSPVEGSFANWTSSISFDESVETGKAGEVQTTVSIPSLALGSVTSQALGADFFNVTAFPTATFTADIMVGADGYTAQGKLTVKDLTMPVVLPFTLLLQKDTAQMHGTLTLDRRDFGMGETVTDAGTLAFEVQLDIKLTATRDPD